MQFCSVKWHKEAQHFKKIPRKHQHGGRISKKNPIQPHQALKSHGQCWPISLEMDSRSLLCRSRNATHWQYCANKKCGFVTHVKWHKEAQYFEKILRKHQHDGRISKKNPIQPHQALKSHGQCWAISLERDSRSLLCRSRNATCWQYCAKKKCGCVTREPVTT